MNEINSATIPHLLRLRQERYEFQHSCQRLLFFRNDDVPAAFDENHSSSSASDWQRSEHQIRQHHGINPNSRRHGGVTTTMDYGDSRFLLTGNQNGRVNIFDMMKTTTSSSKDRQLPSNIHEPIQQATMPGGPIRTVQWYPVDTGMFLTASNIGSLRIWDTNAMECVLNIQPFPQRRDQQQTPTGIHAMQVSKYECTLAAVAGGDRLLKIVDLRSGASAHTLPSNGGTVQCVQWSPVSSHLLFSCGKTSIPAIWDIRRPGPPLTVLDIEIGSSNSLVSKPYSIDGLHWRRNNNNNKKNKNQIRSVATASNSNHGATTGVWDPSGTHIVTVNGSSRNIDVWDMRRSPPNRYRRRLISETGNPPVDANTMSQPLTMFSCGYNSYKRHDQMIWVAKGTCLRGYSMLAKDSETDSGKPNVILKGHLAKVECILATTDQHLFSSAQDGLVLVWEPRHRFQNKKSSSSLRLTTNQSSHKRTRPWEGDVDSW